MAATNKIAMLQPTGAPHLATLNCSKHIHSIINTANRPKGKLKPNQNLNQQKNPALLT